MQTQRCTLFRRILLFLAYVPWYLCSHMLYLIGRTPWTWCNHPKVVWVYQFSSWHERMFYLTPWCIAQPDLTMGSKVRSTWYEYRPHWHSSWTPQRFFLWNNHIWSRLDNHCALKGSTMFCALLLWWACHMSHSIRIGYSTIDCIGCHGLIRLKIRGCQWTCWLPIVCTCAVGHSFRIGAIGSGLPQWVCRVV